MASYRLSDASVADIEEIFHFIAQDDLDIADRFVDELFEKFILLAGNKLIGYRQDSFQDGLRSMSFGRYIIFYFPIANGIHVYRVLHSARDIESILENDLEN